MFKNSSLPITLNCLLGLLVLPIYRQSKTTDPSLRNDWPGKHHPLLHQINFDNIWKPHGETTVQDRPRTDPKPLRFYAEACGIGYRQ
ncbi:hypothetical protein TNCV_5085451 [Trichonephila clavipes]|uniref:Uncharacterized protein n=1 Tax=Trichonephila clavipes TaxID=2585209 RepID=A0A8X6S9T3_TRICX|nr:hypothetical protein TNCV_5085451 [Trichonephila clavipes]